MAIEYLTKQLDDFGNTTCEKWQLPYVEELKEKYPDLQVRKVKELKRFGRPSITYIVERDRKYFRSNPEGINLGGLYG